MECFSFVLFSIKAKIKKELSTTVEYFGKSGNLLLHVLGEAREKCILLGLSKILPGEEAVVAESRQN